MTPVTVRSTRNHPENIQVHFDSETDQELETIAQQRGLPKASLIHAWVLERLRQERGEHRTAS